MLKNSLILFLAAFSLSACLASREELMTSIFPDPADRTGLELVFPLESGGQLSILEIVFNPAVVTQETVLARASKHCSQYGKVAALSRGPFDGSRTLEDGSKLPLVKLFTQCV